LTNQCRSAQVRGGGGILSPNNGDDANQINSTVGGNTRLKPEKAKMWTVGAVFEPSMVRNLSLTVDYGNVNVRQVLGFNTTAVITMRTPDPLRASSLRACSPTPG